eukprot:ANDGO_01940.mRNA.1 hypothetical protein
MQRTAFMCPVCWEEFTPEGDRQMVGLKSCGHVFCQPCVNLLSQRAAATPAPRSKANQAECPVCKQSFHSQKDPRPLFVSSTVCPVEAPPSDQINRLTDQCKSLGRECVELRFQVRSLTESLRRSKSKLAAAAVAAASHAHTKSPSRHPAAVLNGHSSKQHTASSSRGGTGLTDASRKSKRNHGDLVEVVDDDSGDAIGRESHGPRESKRPRILSADPIDITDSSPSRPSASSSSSVDKHSRPAARAVRAT